MLLRVFTPLNWEYHSGDMFDKSNQTFIFSLNLMKKYNMIDCNKRVFYYSCFEGPNFGFMDFEIMEMKEDGFSYLIGNANFLPKNNFEIIGLKGEVDHFILLDYIISLILFSFIFLSIKYFLNL